MNIPELLAAALPQDCVTTEAWALQSYGCDRTTIWPAQAVAVVRPRHIDEVQRCVQLANEHGFAVVPSGGRTGLSGGAVASNGEVVLSLERMNRIVDFDPVDASVRVEAGVVTAQLQDYARDKGLCYPVDFAAAGSSQIGGNIATNAGGIKVIRYGMTRDRVRGLSVVTGKGERLELNRGLLKNNTGYDFRHLFVGSEGTLGVICEATLALAPAPADPLVLVLGVPRFADVLEVLASFRQRFSLSAFECFSDNGLRKVCAAHQLPPPLSTPAAYYALIEVDECDGATEQAVAAFEYCVAQGWVSDGVVSQSLGQAAELWKLREYLSETLAAWTPYKNDISVAVSRLPAFLAEADALMAARYPDCEVVWYGHIGDGNLHLNILKPERWSKDDFLARCSAVTDELGDLLVRHGGSISAEHGVGLLKRDHLHYTRSPAEIELMRGMKALFDPRGVLNPGKLIG
ncbi:MAG: FAD-binding oxidoreductase [Oceanococcus sp.]|nr:MAG: FAD-binding oxidoreductase [Oceanococcus sp.]